METPQNTVYDGIRMNTSKVWSASRWYNFVTFWINGVGYIFWMDWILNIENVLPTDCCKRIVWAKESPCLFTLSSNYVSNEYDLPLWVYLIWYLANMWHFLPCCDRLLLIVLWQICGVSILRAGETMEPALCDVCKDVSLGKILIQTNLDTGEPEVSHTSVITDSWS